MDVRVGGVGWRSGACVTALLSPTLDNHCQGHLTHLQLGEHPSVNSEHTEV